ncbi:MAG TPA: HlyD family secretion protein [Dissulfurispiraceae bacterium]|nr:HlyD family secretion protein [Dissulfurispiraceae bacterium]
MEETKSNNNRRKKAALVIFVIVALIGAVTLYVYLRYKATHISTDDAFVDGDVHTIASRVDGTVKDLLVKSNQFVRKGDVLVELDVADYDVKVREAQSGLEAEKARLSEVEARIEASRNQLSELRAAGDASRANLDLQEANLRQAELDIRRAENLFKKEAVSKERYEKAATAYEVSLAQVKAAREQVKQSDKALETQKAVVKQAEVSRTAQSSAVKERAARLSSAELNFGYTKICAPADGYVTKKSVEIGNQVKTGQPLMAVVPLDTIYITANYKETQLEKIKVGQKVKIKVDTFPGKTFQGKVESIMAGTGAVFSLFPPENATGNFVKVVQRIPVKIVLDKDTDREHVLRVGMSVMPTVVVEN